MTSRRRALTTILSMAAVAASVPGCSGPSSASRDEAVTLQGKPPTPESDPFFYAARPPESARAETSGMIGESTPPPDDSPPPAKDAADSAAEEAPPTPVEASPAADPAELAALRERAALAEAARDEAEARLIETEVRVRELASRNEALASKNRELATHGTQLERAREELRQSSQRLTAQRNAAQEAERDLDAARRELALLRDELERRDRDLRAARAAQTAPKPTERAARVGEQCFSCVRICPLEGRCDADADVVCGWGTGPGREAAQLRARTECDAALDVLRRGDEWSRVEGACPAASCE